MGGLSRLLPHNINVPPALLLPLCRALPPPSSRRRTQQIINTTRVTHSCARSTRRCSRRSTASNTTPITDTPAHPRRHQIRLTLRRKRRTSLGNSALSRWRNPRRRRRPSGRRSACSSRWARPWRRRGRGLSFRVFGAGFLVDPALELGVVDEVVGFPELSFDGLVGLRTHVWLFLGAAEPAAETPATALLLCGFCFVGFLCWILC